MSKRTFKVMVTFPDLLKERISEHNKLYNTNFELVEIVEDEVPLCIISSKNENETDIFNIGYGLADKQ